MAALKIVSGVTRAAASNDRQLVQRLMAAFLRSNEAACYGADSQWRDIRQRQGAIVTAILRGDVDEVQHALQHPHESYLFYGFEDLGEWSVKAYSDPARQQLYAEHCYQLLIRLAQAIGVQSVPNPEAPDRQPDAIEPSALAERLEQALGIDITPPEIYPRYYGLRTSRGVLSGRVINALYCAHRVRQLTMHLERPRILEIGAGLGRLAHYCYAMGITDYSIVDVPLTSLAHGHFLSRALGESRVLLDGESIAVGQGHCIRIFNSERFFAEVRGPFDLIVNVDSLTELGRTLATRYFERIGEIGDCFLSVNHEVNEYRVRDLHEDVRAFARCERMPYWIRDGYIEEVFRH